MNYDKDTLNQELLFNSRKMFGMFGNIQWHITDVSGDILRVQVSSQRTDIKKDQIGKNIIESIQYHLPKADIQLGWVS